MQFVFQFASFIVRQNHFVDQGQKCVIGFMGIPVCTERMLEIVQVQVRGFGHGQPNGYVRLQKIYHQPVDTTPICGEFVRVELSSGVGASAGLRANCWSFFRPPLVPSTNSAVTRLPWLLG